jgi:hypothetical protein
MMTRKKAFPFSQQKLQERFGRHYFFSWLLAIAFHNLIKASVLMGAWKMFSRHIGQV